MIPKNIDIFVFAKTKYKISVTSQISKKKRQRQISSRQQHTPLLFNIKGKIRYV